MWIKLCTSIALFCTVLFAVSGCGTSEIKDERRMGEELSIQISETASFEGEQLRIKFIEISEDSRCPRNVQCVWEGRAIAVIEVLKGDTSQKVELVEQGLTDGLATKSFGEYEFLFRILPYPGEAEVQISPDDYRLMLTVNKE